MNEDGRFIPPGPGRSAAFSHKGGFGKSALLSTGCGFLAVGAVAAFLQNLVLCRLAGLVHAGLDTAVNRASPPSAVVGNTAWTWGGLVIPFVIAIAGGTTAGALLPALIARKGKGLTAVLLPKIPRAVFSIGAVRFFGAVVFIAAFSLSIREIKFDLLGPIGWIGALGQLTVRFITILGAVMVLTGAAEVLILRHLSFRALFLNRSEHRREMKNQEGAREMTDAGRRRLRREAAP